MKNSIKILALLICTQLTASSELVKIKKQSLFASHKLGEVDLFHHNGQFAVKHDNTFHHVETHNIVDPELRNIKLASLSKMLDNGKIHITQNQDKEFVLRSHYHLNGGGFGTGKLFGGIVKVGGYFGIAVACVFHPDTLLHAEELKHSVELAAIAAEAVGNALPTP